MAHSNGIAKLIAEFGRLSLSVCMATLLSCPHGQYHGNWEMTKSSEQGQTTRQVCNLLNFLVLFDEAKNYNLI